MPSSLRLLLPNRPIEVFARFSTVIVFTTLGAAALAQSVANLPGVAFYESTMVAPQPGGGIQAIDMRTGATRWTSSRASWALLAGQGKVVALGNLKSGNTCSICFLDVETGQVTAEVGPIEFVSWAKVKVDFRRKEDADFRIWAQNFSAGGAIFLWKAERWSPIDIRHLGQQQVKQYASGRITVGFASNSVDTRPMQVSATPPEGSPPDRSLPLLRGEKALGSVTLGDGSYEVALVSRDSGLTLDCFVNRLKKWSVPVTKK